MRYCLIDEQNIIINIIECEEQNADALNAKYLGDCNLDFGDLYIPQTIPLPAEEQIVLLKATLAETDYKIIKCSEYQLAGLELPYDISQLHTERQTLRDEINALENKL